MDLKKILVLTDFSDNARAAIEPARALAERFGAKLEFLHVYEVLPLGVPEWNVLSPDGNPVAARVFLKNLATQEMDKLINELRGTGVVAHGLLEEGSVWRAVKRVVERDHYDLVVVSSHGRTGFERAIMGSTAEKVVRHAPCPVFVVRPRGIA